MEHRKESTWQRLREGFANFVLALGHFLHNPLRFFRELDEMSDDEDDYRR